MTSLESVVLPLVKSRALVEHGIVLDTALGWYPTLAADGESVGEGGVVWATDLVHWDALCPAPVLSELLDAIRARCLGNIGFCHFKESCGKMVWQVWWGESELLSRGQAYGEGDTFLQAAAALLMEVSK